MCRMFTVTIGNEKKYLLLEQRRGDLGNHVRLNALRRLVKNHKLDVFQKHRKRSGNKAYDFISYFFYIGSIYCFRYFLRRLANYR